MKRQNIKDKNNMLFSYLRTYLIVLFIPLVICSLYSIRVLNIIEEDDISKIVKDYGHSAESLDTFLNEVEGISRSIADNATVRAFAGKTSCFTYPNLYRIIELRKALSNISFANEYIYDYFIFFDKSETVVNAKAAYTYEEFYNLYFHGQQYETYEDWYEQNQSARQRYGLNPMQTYVFHEGNTIIPMLTYEIPIISYSLSDKSVIKIYLYKEAIASRMPSLPDTGLQFITDRQGNVIFYESCGLSDSGSDIAALSNSQYHENDVPFSADSILNLAKANHLSSNDTACKMVRYEGSQYLLVQCSSASSGLTYYALQSSLAVKVRGYTTVLYMLLFISIAAAVGILLSIRMSQQIAKPVNELINNVMESGHEFDHRTIFSHLQKSYKKLKDVNLELQDVIEAQRPYLQNFFLNQLLYGNTNLEEDEILRNAEYVHFDYHDKVFWVVLFKIEAATETLFEQETDVQNLYILSVTEAAKKIIPDAWIVNSGQDKAIAILTLPRKEQENYRDHTEIIVHKIRNELVSHVSELLYVYVGTVVSNMTEISFSYENAVITHLYRGQESDKNIVWYVHQKAKPLSYPSMEKNNVLFRRVLRGEVESVYTSFKEIIQQFFMEGDFSPYMQNLLLDELQINLVKIMEFLEMEETQYKEYYLLLEQNHNSNLLDRIRITRNIYMQISQYVYEQKSKKAFDLAAITAYINLNFGDSNLSLTSAAEALQMNEGYLSGRFKQETGMNFSSYVEKIRMDKARELLRTGNMTIKEIAEHTGYTSENSFCRAFKRVTGMSTSEWRNADTVR